MCFGVLCVWVWVCYEINWIHYRSQEIFALKFVLLVNMKLYSSSNLSHANAPTKQPHMYIHQSNTVGANGNGGTQMSDYYGTSLSEETPM